MHAKNGCRFNLLKLKISLFERYLLKFSDLYYCVSQSGAKNLPLTHCLDVNLNDQKTNHF
jgi:hypothetical protein